MSGETSTAEKPDGCPCGWTVPTTFPREPARGDWCPIGPLNLHHWHDADCVFCGRFRADRDPAPPVSSVLPVGQVNP